MGHRSLTSRRKFLKAVAYAASVSALPALVSACGGSPDASNPATSTTAPAAVPTAGVSAAAPTAAAAAVPTAPAAVATADIKLLGAGWPFGPLPKSDAIAADPGQKSYASALQDWLDKNPGVSVEGTDLNIWDTQALVTAISGGTAPAAYNASTAGGYNQAATFAAFKQGLFADITPLIEKYKITSRLADYAAAAVERTGQVGGQYFTLPTEFSVYMGTHYRKDLVRELGLKEPQVGWTWDDFRVLIKGLTSTKDKRKGVCLQKWAAGGMFDAHGFNLVSNVPAPEQGWHWAADYTSNPLWAKLAEGYRELMFKDQAILSDVALGDDDYAKAFGTGATGVMWNGIGFFTRPKTNAQTLLGLEEVTGKPIDEVVGFTELPRGTNGFYTNRATGIGGPSFNPDLSPEALEKAFSLVDYLSYGEGRTIQAVGTWEATKDLKQVFQTALTPDGVTTFEGVPGSFEEAWGKNIAASARAVASIANPPDQANFFPAEKNPGPDTKAFDDMLSTVSSVADGVDVNAELKKAQDAKNQQITGFTSSTSAEDFKKSAQAFYAANDAFWQKNAPTFYADVYQPWYEKNVKPNIG